MKAASARVRLIPAAGTTIAIPITTGSTPSPMIVAPHAHFAWRSIVPGVPNAISTCDGARARHDEAQQRSDTTAPTASAARRPVEAFAR